MRSAQEAYEQLLEPALPELHAPKLRATCAQLRAWGALGAKFSGAGGEGSVIALLPDAVQSQQVTARLRQSGLEAWEVPLRRSLAD